MAEKSNSLARGWASIMYTTVGGRKVWVTRYVCIASSTASGSAWGMHTSVAPKANAGHAKAPAPCDIGAAMRNTGGFLTGMWA